MSLVVKLFSRSANFKPNEFLGKVCVALYNYDMMEENRVWKDLELSKEREVCMCSWSIVNAWAFP